MSGELKVQCSCDWQGQAQELKYYLDKSVCCPKCNKVFDAWPSPQTSDQDNFPTTKYDAHGKRNLMARAKGYVMCRRPYCSPHVLSEKEWLEMSDTEAPYVE